jgi:hypothetical protein
MKLLPQMMNRRCRSLGQPSGGKESNENANQAKPGLCRDIFDRILTMLCALLLIIISREANGCLLHQ